MSTKLQFANRISNLTPLGDNVIVANMNFGSRQLSSGIIMLGDDAKTDGIRPRWAMVFAVGPDQQDVKPGQWVLVEHGRWTRGCVIEMQGTEMVIRKIDKNAILLVSDETPNFDDMISGAVHAERKERNYE
jgi:co-chaperonin GroES (HSP10)